MITLFVKHKKELYEVRVTSYIYSNKQSNERYIGFREGVLLNKEHGKIEYKVAGGLKLDPDCENKYIWYLSIKDATTPNKSGYTLYDAIHHMGLEDKFFKAVKNTISNYKEKISLNTLPDVYPSPVYHCYQVVSFVWNGYKTVKKAHTINWNIADNIIDIENFDPEICYGTIHECNDNNVIKVNYFKD